MRVLFLRFQERPEPSWVEAFLRFTPRIAMGGRTGLFLEIASTQHLFGGETALLAAAVAMGERLSGAPVAAAIADRAATAQILAFHAPGAITAFGDDARAFAELPLEALIDFEGMMPWPAPKVNVLIVFFRSLGFRKIGQLQELSRAQLQERWGELGIGLWKRLKTVDEQAVSPWMAREPLTAYAHFEDPAAHVSLVERKLEPLLERLFLRLEGQSRFARALTLTLHCEWSDARHEIRVEPVSAGRDLGLFRDLLSRKLDELDLDNPIKEVEAAIEDVPEKIQQLDFFEPRDGSESRWRRLISFAAQGGVEMGFVQMKSAHFAEDTVTFKPAEPRHFELHDHVEKLEEAVQVKPVYAKALSKAPRPSLLLDPPRELDAAEAASLKPLTSVPAERVTGPWWRSKPAEGRDYFFALSQEGRLLWIFRDKITRKVFLHGAFD